ncbi:MAG: hypothetical protein AB8B51_09290 [Sedimentitalea sp.]
MKAMLAAFVAMIVISVAAWYGLGEAGFSAADQGSSPGVRLD